jgi:hypothetical protein
MRPATLKQSALRRERRADPAVVDLTAYETPHDDAATSAVPERVREFYKANTGEVIARMRNPTEPTNNIAAGIVLQCETNPRLRSEAERALDVAKRAGEARNALDDAISFYEAPNRA